MKKASRPFSTMTKSAFTLLPLLLVNVSDPVQSLLTWYVPVVVSRVIVPLKLFVSDPESPPCPSKTVRPTTATSALLPFGRTTEPFPLKPYAPLSVALLQPSSRASLTVSGTRLTPTARPTTPAVAMSGRLHRIPIP